MLRFNRFKSGTVSYAAGILDCLQQGRQKQRSRLNRRAAARRHNAIPVAVERVEDRTLLVAWIAQGPSPAIDGQVEGIDPGGENQVAGALHTVVAHPTDADILWAGSVNGGIWRTNDATAPGGPTWLPQTDNVESLSIGALAIDPTDSDRLVAGNGAHSSFGRDSDDLGSILVTTDGGNNWSDPGSVGLGTVAPAGESITSVAIRGSDILVTSRINFGGVFKSTDGGATFTAISSASGSGFSSPGQDFWDLVEDPTDATHMRVYAAAEDNGIYRSDDFGSTWTAITGPTINAEMDDIITDAGNNNTEMAVSPVTGRLYTAIIISGRPEAIFYSDDADTAAPSWTRMDIPVLPNASPLTIATATAATPVVITTTTPHGLSPGDRVVVSGVTGNAGALGNFAITPTSATTFELDFSVGTGAGTGGTVTPVVGLSPTGNKPGGQGGLHFAIIADPTDPDLVYVGGDRQDTPFPTAVGATSFSGSLFRGDTSIAGDATAIPSPQWDHLTHDAGGLGGTFDPTGGTASGSAPHADSRDMVFDADGNLVEVDDGGIYVRTSPKDNTGDWFSLNGNLQITEMHDVAYDPVHGTIISGNQDTGTTYQPAPGAAKWVSLTTADGGDVAVAPVTGSPGSSARFSSFQFLGSFLRSTWTAPGAPDSFTVIDTGFIPDKQFVTPIALNAVDPTRLAIGGSSLTYESAPGIDVTVDALGAGSFAAVPTSGGVNRNAMAFGHASDPDLLVIGSGSTVGIRPTGSAMVPTAAPIPSGAFIQDIIIDPAPFAPFAPLPTFFAATASPEMVWMSPDGGTMSWLDLTGNLPTLGSDVQQLEYVELGPGADALIAATNNGVFFLPETASGFAASAASGFWTELGAGLPNGLAYDLDYDPGADVLVVGTMGRGAWLLPEVTLAVTGPIEDFGDAPDTYLTLDASGGAKHVAIGPVLGVASDTEGDASGPLDGTGDGDDEDGVTISGPLTVGTTETVVVDVLSGPALLNAFIDFDGDGSFGAGETVATDVTVNSGPNDLSFLVPAGAATGATFARFRLSTAALSGAAAGAADDGEVEDYAVTISAAASTVDIDMTQTDSIDPVIAGSSAGNLTYIVTATNNGPDAATGVVIEETLTLPAGVAVGSITPSSGGYAGTTWTLGALGTGASATLTIVLTVDSSAAAGTDTISSTATVTGVGETDAVPGNDAVTTSTSIVREVDIELTATESIDPVVAGSAAGNLTYIVTATNNGPSDATGVTISDALTLPAGVIVASITPSAGTSFSDPTWTVGDIDSGDIATLTVVLTVDPSAVPGTDVISNTVTLTAVTETDTAAGNDTVTTATSVIREVDIELTATESIDPVVAGSGAANLTYVITATNNGPSDATGVTLAEVLTLPVGVTVDSVTPSAGTSFADPTWTIGDLADGGSETLTIVLTVAGSALPGTDVISSTATVTAVTETDTVAGNDSVTTATSISTTSVPTIEDITFYNADAALEDVLSLDSTGQRSIIRHIEVTIDGEITVPTGAIATGSISLKNLDTSTSVGLSVDSAAISGGMTTIVLSFTSGTGASGSLVDGNYRLLIDGILLGVDADDSGSVGGTNTTDFHRLFGDSDGDRDVDGQDYMNFYAAHFGDAAFTNVFDLDDDDIVADDIMAFFMQFGKILAPF